MEVSRQLHALAAPLRERTPGKHWIGGWVGPRASLDALLKRKFPDRPIIQPAAQHYTAELFWLLFFRCTL